MPILNSIVAWVMKKRMHQIELFMKYPSEVQLEVFNKLITTSKDTVWGKSFDYASITNYNTFKNRIPIQDYEDVKPYVDRIQKGEKNLLWPSEIKWFAKSSGTTSDKSKYIPISQESLDECHFKGGKDMISIYCNNVENTQLFTGKNLALGGSHQNFTTDGNDFFTGDLSAIIIQNLPLLAEVVRTPSIEIALMNEWESKIEKLAQSTINENVTSIAGVPSWQLLLLKHILQKTGKSNIHEIWPNLEVFFHGGVNFSPYYEQFNNLMASSQMNYLETYNASEGFFGIEDQINSNELLLMLDYGIFYEFIPMSQINSDSPQTFTISEVEKGINYAMLISTNSGLWRYKIGDTVEFTSLFPFRIKITGRTKHFINAFGEELIIDNAEKALKIACDKTHAIISNYSAAPIYTSNLKQGAHQWIIEFEKEPDSLDFFGIMLDNALKSLNSDYEAKRYKDMILKNPEIISLPKNTFYIWLKSKNKLGGQNKVPRLSNNRVFVDEILQQINYR